MSIVPRDIHALLADVKEMVRIGVLVQDYEVEPDSFVCFISTKGGKSMYHVGKLTVYPADLQRLFMGLYLNESVGDYKITGIYKPIQEFR